MVAVSLNFKHTQMVCILTQSTNWKPGICSIASHVRDSLKTTQILLAQDHNAPYSTSSHILSWVGTSWILLNYLPLLP